MIKMKKNFILVAALAATTFASCDKTETPTGGIKENPNATSISGVALVKSGIEVDPEGFNMLTDGGFERFAGDENWKSKSLWYLPEWDTEAETAYSGNRTVYADCNVDGWRDVAAQTVCLKKNQSYTFSINYRGAWDGLNVYMGFRAAENHDQNLNQEGVGAEWAEYSYTLENVDDVEASAFMGGWCWYNLWLEADDFKVIPTGTNNDSFMPSSAAIVSNGITNASFDEISSISGIVSWIDEDGSISSVLNGAAMGDATKMVFSASNDKNVNDGLKFATASPMIDDSDAVATAGVTANGTKYVHYYKYSGVPEATEENANPDWTASEAGLLSSTDGETWTVSPVKWSGEGNFVNAAFCKKGDFVYMFGYPAGDANVRTYVARVKASAMNDATNYEYWDGGEWVAGDETAAAPVFYGPVQDLSVIYNSDKYTFMAIYKSSKTGGLVYRDAGLAEGEWSGEKIFLLDENLSTPSILSTNNNEIWLLANTK